MTARALASVSLVGVLMWVGLYLLAVRLVAVLTR